MTGTTSQGYTGLGSPKSVFEAGNEQAPPNPAGATAGLAWYTVLSTNAAGRVTAFDTDENVQPPWGDRDRIDQTAGILLPADAIETSLNGNACDVWKSPTLRRLIGMEYAAATTTTGTTTADMRAEVSPAC